jgi:hypothetical protein
MQQPVYFNAGQIAFWNVNRHVYQVYVLPGELLFIKLGTGFRDPRSVSPASVVGAIAGKVAASIANRKMRQIAEKKQQLDEASLEELRSLTSSGKGNFVVTPDNMTHLSLEPASWFLGLMLSGSQHAGILRLRHQRSGKFKKLELFNGEDARTAFLELPKALGDRIRINAAWSDKQQQLVKVSARG